MKGNQNTMNLIKKHEALSFYLATYIMTGILFVIPALLIPTFPFPLYLLAPAIFAFVIVGITQGTSGIQQILRSLLPSKAQTPWLLISLCLPTLLIYLSDIALRLILAQDLSYQGRIIPVTLSLILTALIGSLGEEVGWRGYLLPLFSTRYGTRKASLFVGVLWALWHAGDYGQGLGYFAQMGWNIALSVIMTWLYFRGKKSLLTAVLFHTMLGIFGTFFGNTLDLRYYTILAIIFGIPALILFITSPVFKDKEATY